MASWGKQTATPAGQTGNNTHASSELPAGAVQVVAVFVVEAVGATPTVTYKWQVSFDPPDLPDASSQWADHAYVLMGGAQDANETFANTTRTLTAVGRDTLLTYLGVKTRAVPRKMRLVTTANTNVTYRGELLTIYV